MEIRFSKAMAFPEQPIRAAAKDAGVYARIKWGRMSEARFILCSEFGGYQPATTEAHDRVIRALLTLDPDAVVRTAKAIYSGRDDFENQVKARCQQKVNVSR